MEAFTRVQIIYFIGDKSGDLDDHFTVSQARTELEIITLCRRADM